MLSIASSPKKPSQLSALAAKRRNDWLSGHSSAVTSIFAITDSLAVILAALLSNFAIFGSFDVGATGRTGILIAVLLTWLVFNAGGSYKSWRGRGYVEQIRAASISWISVVMSLVLSAYLIGATAKFDRATVILWAIVGYVLIVMTRLSVMSTLRIARRRGLNHQRIIVVGGGKWGRQVVERVHDSVWLGLDVVCVLDHNPELHGSSIDGVSVLGGYDLLPSVVSEDSIDEVWICLPLGSKRSEGRDYISGIMDMLGHTTVTQRLLPEFEEMRILNQPVTEIMGLPVITLNSSPMHGLNRFIKGVEDRVLSLLILIAISPVMAAIAIAIKMDTKGPVFFRQMRHGSDGKPFSVIKFRTMGGHDVVSGELMQATRKDPRITKVGRFLRKNSLDELPQFINVLQGKMSIVGPRPHAIEHNNYYKDRIRSYMQRHSVKPGITGWAQVNGYRGETNEIQKMQKRVSLDLYYVEHWSLWFDIRIIARTILHGFRHENAY